MKKNSHISVASPESQERGGQSKTGGNREETSVFARGETGRYPHTAAAAMQQGALSHLYTHTHNSGKVCNCSSTVSSGVESETHSV